MLYCNLCTKEGGGLTWQCFPYFSFLWSRMNYSFNGYLQKYLAEQNLMKCPTETLDFLQYATYASGVTLRSSQSHLLQTCCLSLWENIAASSREWEFTFGWVCCKTVMLRFRALRLVYTKLQREDRTWEFTVVCRASSMYRLIHLTNVLLVSAWQNLWNAREREEKVVMKKMDQQWRSIAGSMCLCMCVCLYGPWIY